MVSLESSNPKDLLFPHARLLTRESRLLLMNLKLSISLSSISLLHSSPSLSMYLSTSTLIKKVI